jgi:hypothetical protein
LTAELLHERGEDRVVIASFCDVLFDAGSLLDVTVTVRHHRARAERAAAAAARAHQLAFELPM